MPTDPFTKFILSVVAVCLLLLVFQGFRPSRPPAPAEDAEGGRYRMAMIPMARAMLRMDSATGTTWKLPLPAADTWVQIAEPGEAEVDTEDPAQAEKPGAVDER